MGQMTGLAFLDWAVVGIYFVFIVVLVWWSSRKQKTSTD
jgi:Na+/proline symporter